MQLITSLAIRSTKKGLCFDIHVNPHASRAEISGVADGALKVRVTVPPVEGAANQAVIALLAKTLGLKKSQLALAAGAQSRRKTILASGLSAAELENKVKKLTQPETRPAAKPGTDQR